MARLAFYRDSLGVIVAAALALVMLRPCLTQAQGIPQAAVSFQQQYQVVFFKDNAAGRAIFLFTTDSVNADGTTSGTLTANIEGNLLQGRFLELTLGTESLWVARAAGPQIVLIARGAKTSDQLAGEASISMAANGQMLQETFFLLGEAAIPLAPAASTLPPSSLPSAQPNSGRSAQPSSGLSAQPNTGPSALNARP